MKVFAVRTDGLSRFYVVVKDSGLSTIRVRCMLLKPMPPVFSLHCSHFFDQVFDWRVYNDICSEFRVYTALQLIWAAVAKLQDMFNVQTRFGVGVSYVCTPNESVIALVEEIWLGTIPLDLVFNMAASLIFWKIYALLTCREFFKRPVPGCCKAACAPAVWKLSQLSVVPLSCWAFPRQKWFTVFWTTFPLSRISCLVLLFVFKQLNAFWKPVVRSYRTSFQMSSLWRPLLLRLSPRRPCKARGACSIYCL